MNLTESTEKRKENLQKKKEAFEKYTRWQIYLSILAMIIFMIYYYFKIGHKSFNGMLGTYEFLYLVIGVAFYNIALEKAGNEAKAKFNSSQNKFKEYMNIVGVCKCTESCRCKQELYDDLSSKGLL